MLDWSAKGVRDLFASELQVMRRTWQHRRRRMRRILGRPFQLLLGEDYAQLTVDLRSCRVGLYDHDRHRRLLHLSDAFCDAFSKHWRTCDCGEVEQRMLVRLFLAHEIHHVAQHLDSDNYTVTHGSEAVFMVADYVADAFASRLVYETLDATCGSWNTRLAQVLFENLSGAQVFARLEDPTGDTITGPRLQRHLVWAFQVARVACFAPERAIDDLALASLVVVELFVQATTTRSRDNLTLPGTSVARNAFCMPVQMHVWVQNRRYVFDFGEPATIDTLATCIWRPTIDSCVETFRRLLSDHPELTGRDAAVRHWPAAIRIAGVFFAMCLAGVAVFRQCVPAPNDGPDLQSTSVRLAVEETISQAIQGVTRDVVLLVREDMTMRGAGQQRWDILYPSDPVVTVVAGLLLRVTEYGTVKASVVDMSYRPPWADPVGRAAESRLAAACSQLEERLDSVVRRR